MPPRAQTKDESPGARSREQRSGDARLLLVLAAEKFFALHGFEGALLKDINDAAGQRNASAIHYHFGSRDGLIEAVLEYRVPSYAAARHAKLEAIEARADPPCLRDLVAAWVEPLAHELRPRAEGNHYIRFLDQLRRTGPAGPRAKTAAMQADYRQMFTLLEERMNAMSQRVRRSRLAMTAELIISGLAQLEAALPGERVDPDDYPALAVANLIDFITAGLSATPAEETSATERDSTSTVEFHLNFMVPS